MIFHIMVLYIYFDNKIMNEINMKVLSGKIHSKMKRNLSNFFLTSLLR